ncbi:MAG: ORF6N domain-containing protein [Bacteroides sp.]|nr:ORF6N domain-containing protein [Bacteroides sp.]
MENLSIYGKIESAIVTVRGQRVILDSDVAQLYGLETKRVNEAVRNNPDKFPDGYIILLDSSDLKGLRSKFSTANLSAKSRVMPKAFTEKGLYMLATILKSPVATRTTIGIVETFAKMRELSRNLSALTAQPDESRRKTLMEQSGELLSDLLDDELSATDSETALELNLAVLKLKHTVKRKKSDPHSN